MDRVLFFTVLTFLNVICVSCDTRQWINPYEVPSDTFGIADASCDRSFNRSLQAIFQTGTNCTHRNNEVLIPRLLNRLKKMLGSEMNQYAELMDDYELYDYSQGAPDACSPSPDPDSCNIDNDMLQNLGYLLNLNIAEAEGQTGSDELPLCKFWSPSEDGNCAAFIKMLQCSVERLQAIYSLENKSRTSWCGIGVLVKSIEGFVESFYEAENSAGIMERRRRKRWEMISWMLQQLNTTFDCRYKELYNMDLQCPYLALYRPESEYRRFGGDSSWLFARSG